MSLLAHDHVQRESGNGDVVVFAHGILGSRNNWKSFARKFSALQAAGPERPGLGTLAVDLRNHGQSHGFDPPHTVDAAADDVTALCSHLGVRPRVVVGHSWGGKAMMQLALKNEDVGVVVVVDAPFGVRDFSEGNEEIDRVLAAVGSVPMPVASRKELVELLKARGLSEPLAQWMTTNLDDQLGWKFDLAAIPEMLSSFGSLDLWPAVEAHRPSLRVHVVRGGRSDRWSQAELEHLQSAEAGGVVDVHVIEKAAHWVHTDDPEALLSVLVASLPP
ncbi:MAG: alpha/beta fold hydrolase [Deltaproteobacteria bacterium]|nr:alpha/beta fold hydrolase [Deltaproteobacteria bacterium]